jgi:general secretion pathway protein D
VEKLVADQDIADPEVMLEVEVLEVTRSRMTNLGLQYPTKMTFTGLPSTVTQDASGTTPAVKQLSLAGLKTINSNSILVTPTPAMTLNLMLQDSDTNILSSPRLRVKNREKAKIMIGERVPIITNSVTPVSTGTPVVTGTVSYQDVGLKFDVEPEIHQDNEVTIKLGLEVSSLGQAVTNSATGSLVYTVGTRNTATSLRLHDGETQILAGLITDNDTSTTDKVPLLGQVPLLGHLFANDNAQKTKTEIILSITPHIVGSKKIPDAREMEYWSGTESMLRSDQLLLKNMGEVSLTGASPSARAAPAPATAGAVPGAAGIPGARPALPGAVTFTPVVPAAKPGPAASSVPEAKPASEAAAPSPIAFTWTGPAQAKVGDKITLSVNAQSLQGVKALGFEVGFDPGVLKAVGVSEGDAMKHNNATASLNKTIDQTAGSVSVDLKGSGAPAGGSVVALTFEVIAPAQGTSVTLSSINATTDSGETQSPTEPVPFSISAE